VTPTLVVVSGPAGTGKTTLAHAVARALGCPAICRDEIKEGLVHANPGFVPAPGDPLTMRTLGLFFDVLGLLVRAGVTVVAEAAFQDRVWRPRLEPLATHARLRVLRCRADPQVARARVTDRLAYDPRRAAHDDRGRLAASGAGFAPISLPGPALDVDTTDGYRPRLDEIVAFVNGPGTRDH